MSVSLCLHGRYEYVTTRHYGRDHVHSCSVGLCGRASVQMAAKVTLSCSWQHGMCEPCMYLHILQHKMAR